MAEINLINPIIFKPQNIDNIIHMVNCIQRVNKNSIVITDFK